MEENDLREDLIEAFCSKKRISEKNYQYIRSPKYDKYFDEAVKLCTLHELPAAQYVQIVWDRLGDAKEFFSPQHLRGAGLNATIKEMKTNLSSYAVEITNASLSYDELWDYQHVLISNYIFHGEDIHDVLMDSSIKLFAWFRILSTPERDEKVIAKYKNTARQEITREFEEFARKNHLDISRIL